MPAEGHSSVIEVFYGISSPWAYLGAPRLRAIAFEAGVEIALRPIRIIQANGGIPLRSRPVARQTYHDVELRRWSAHLGIALNVAPKFYPCRTIEPAARMVIAAGQIGLDDVALSWAIQRALWAEDRDIADDATLRTIAGEALGAAIPDLRAAADATGPVAAWARNLADAERLGIFGTPTYVVDGELYWGQDRLDFVRDRLLGWDERRQA